MSVRNIQGFTLLELLMAIAIFGMVIGLAYSSYNATFQIIQGAGAQAATYSKAKIALERIVADLESFYPGEAMLFKGGSDNLQFTSTAHVQLHPDVPPMGNVIIHYRVTEDPDSESLLLYRAEQPALGKDQKDDKENPGLLLCDTLEEVLFEYRDKDGQDQEGWGDDEGATEAASLPALITISLRFNDGEDDAKGSLFKTSLTLPVATQ
jgi:prepilin-type N-terminal cleavage/methylation domain-containing protein